MNIIGSRRRDHRVVFEELMPADIMRNGQRPRPASMCPASAGPRLEATPIQAQLPAWWTAAGFAAPGAAATAPPPPPRRYPSTAKPPTSPWAIVPINRVDLPVSVEQRLFPLTDNSFFSGL